MTSRLVFDTWVGLLGVLMLVGIGVPWSAAGTITSVVPSAVTADVTVRVTGSGFAASPTQNEVVFQPMQGAATAGVVTAVSAPDATGQLRRLTVRVPVGLPIGRAAIIVRNLTNDEVSQGGAVEIVALVAGRSTAAPGTAVDLRITLQGNAAFDASANRVSVGAGVTVNRVTVMSPKELVASVSVASTAVLGPRSLGVLTPVMTAVAASAFAVATEAPPPTNLPPVVGAGADQRIALPISDATLQGTATDDGLPTGSALTLAWSQVSGPSTAVIVTPASLATTASGLTAGTYVFRLTASDGQLSATDEVTVTVDTAPPPPPTNLAPVVTAGADQTVTLPISQATLQGTATDDGLPTGSTLTLTWTLVSGPNTPVIVTPASLATTVSGLAAGTYVFRLSASDGELSALDTVQVTVSATPSPPPPPPPTNDAPTIDVGEARTMTLPDNTLSLAAQVADDGLPAGAGTSVRWSVVSGPAPVVYGDAGAASTTAVFPRAGTWVLRATATDGELSAFDEVTVVVNPGPSPPPPPNRPPTADPGGPYTADAGGPIGVYGLASSDPDGETLTYAWTFGDGGTATGGTPVHAWAQAGTFTVSLTVTDPRSGSDTKTTSVTVGPPADRAPPSVSLRVPAEVLPGTTVQLFADAFDNVGVTGVAIDVAGAGAVTLTEAPYQRSFQVPGSAVPGTKIPAGATARDAVGNSGTASASMTIVAAPDVTPPTVTLVLPPTASPGAAILLGAAAADNVRVASVAFLQGAATLASDGVAPYEAGFTIPPGAQIGSVISLVARATDDAGNSAEDTRSLTVVALPDTTPPTVTLSAPERARPGDTIDLVASAQDDRGVADVTFTVDEVPIASVTTPPYRTRYTVPPSRAAGAVVRSRARATDTSALTAAAVADTRVSDGSVGTALVFGAVYDDSTGLPLGHVDVAVTGDDGSGAPFTAAARTDASGRYAAAVRSGEARLRFTRAGFTVVERRLPLASGAANRAIDARLTPQVPTSTNVPAAAGGTVARATATLVIEPGALAADALVRVTPVGAQGLAALLPAGWSPVAAWDVAPAGLDLGVPAAFTAGGLGATSGASLVAARWDPNRGAWISLGTVTVSAEGVASSTLDRTGQLVFLRADASPLAPSPTPAGTSLDGVGVPALAGDATALVSPDPRIAVYDPGVRSMVTATLAAGSLPSSGLVLRARLPERYRFYSGDQLAPDVRVQDIVFYQRPGVGGGLASGADFVVSPSLVFEAASLEEGVITVEVRAAEAADSTFSVTGADGMKILAPTGESLTVPAGALAGEVPASVRRLEAGSLGVPLTESLEFIGGVDVDVAGATLALPASMAVPRPDALVDETGLLVLRLGTFGGRTLFELVGVGRIAGAQVVSDTAIPGLATPLPGIREGGRYVVARALVPLGTFTGVVSGSDGQTFEGALLSTSAIPVVARSRAAGAYVLIAAAAPLTLTAADLDTQDEVSVAITLSGGAILRRDLRLLVEALRVTSVTPLDGAVDVTPGAPITFSFSRSIDPASTAAVRVQAPDGIDLLGTVTLSDSDRIATFRPAGSWPEKTHVLVRIETTLRDRTGRALPAAFASQFTTLDPAAPAPPPAGSITATLPVNGIVTVTGTQGTAGLRDTVRIVNLTMRTFLPVLVNPDGSFSANVPATVRDALAVSITGASGNETSVALPAFTTTNADGSRSTFVGAEGGRVLGPDGVAVDVPAGAFPDGTVMTVKPVAEAEFPMELSADQREFFGFTAGLELDFAGATPTTHLDVSVPAGPNDKLSDRWVLVGVLEAAGRTFLTATDTAKVIDGRIVTASPPCPGVQAATKYGFVKAFQPMSVVYGNVSTSVTDLGGPVTVGISQPLFRGATGALSMPWSGLVAGFAAREQCFPVLTARVSMSPNSQKLKIEPSQFTPASRAIVARNATGNVEQRFPRNVVEYRFVVAGTPDDRYEVTVRTVSSGQTVPFDVSPAQAAGRVSVRVDMDKVGQAATSIVVRNLSRTPVGVTEFPQSDVAARVPVPGSSSDQFEVKVEDVATLQRPVQFTVESPTGQLPLVVRALPGTIDDDTRVVLTNVNSGVTTEVAAAEISQGGFVRDVPGQIGDAYKLTVNYADRTPVETFLPAVRLVVRSAATGRVLRSYNVPAPPPDEPFLNLGTVTDDTQPPALIGTPARLTDFDPSAVLSFRFSESLARDRVLSGLQVTGPDGLVGGEVRLSERNQVISFVPTRPLQLGKSYTVLLQGITDLAGNAFDTTTFELRTTAPKSLATQIGKDAPGAIRDLAFVDLNGRRTVLALGNDQFAATGRLQVVNLTSAAAPVVTGSGPAGNRRVAVLKNVTNLPLRDENECGGGRTFTGDLALSTYYYNGAASIQITDLRNPAAPCRMGGRTIVSANGSQVDGIIPGVGFVNGVAGLIAANGVFAYAAVGQVGLFQIEVGQNSPTPPPRDRPLEPYVSGDYWDVVAAGGVIAGLERSAQRVDLFDPSLARLQSVDLSGFGELLGAVHAEEFPVDADQNGELDRSELRSLLFVGTRRGVVTIDLTDIDAPRVEGLIAVLNGAWQLQVDVPRRRLIVGSVPADAEFVVRIFDLGGPDPFRTSGDADGDGTDDRVIWNSPRGLYNIVTSNFRGMRFDPDRQLLYVGRDGQRAGEAGFDVWSLGNTCCDLSADMKAAPGPPQSEDKKALLARERRALQQGLAAGLRAAASCGVPIRSVLPAPPTPDSLAVLEQGSGACLWKEDFVLACERSYQPGLSDHDFEVLVPAAYFQSGGTSPADCVTKKLSEQFTDAEDGTSKPIDVDGVTVRFSDVTFFPVVREYFEEGKLRVDPPVASGNDPTGDLGLGRQQLLMKWVLEGEYVRVPGFDLAGAALDDVLEALKAKGVPRVEGHEWAKLQQLNLIKSRALLRLAGASRADSSFNTVFRGQVKDAAKAAIRATLARMAVDPAAMAVVFSYDRTDYSESGCLVMDGIDETKWLDTSCGGFEHFVASMAGRTVQRQLPLFTALDVANQIARFSRVKAGEERITEEADADAFIRLAWRFVKRVDDETRDVYFAELPAADFREQREKNFAAAIDKTAKALANGQLQVVPRVRNAGFFDARDVQLAMYRGVGGPGTGTQVKAQRLTLGANEERFLERQNDVRAVPVGGVSPEDRNLLDISPIDPSPRRAAFVLGDGSPGNPPVDMSLSGPPRWVAFTVDLPEHLVKEADRENNVGGFWYYVLDRDGDPPPPSLDEPVPLPIADPNGDVLRPDAECEATPALTVTQSAVVSLRVPGAPLPTQLELSDYASFGLGEPATFRLRVTNTGPATVNNVTLCSSIYEGGAGCFQIGTLPPQQAQVREFTRSFDTAMVIAATATTWGATVGAVSSSPMRLEVGCDPLVVLPPSPDPNPRESDPAAEVMRGGDVIRHYRVIDRVSGEPKAGVPVEISFEVTGRGLETRTFTSGADGFLMTGTETGVVFPVAAAVEPPSRLIATVTKVGGTPAFCNADTPLFTARVTDRTYSRSWTAGSSISVTGAVEVGLSGKSGYGFSFGLSEVAGKPAAKLSVGRTASTEAAAVETVLKTGVSGSFLGATAEAGMKADAGIALQKSEGDGYDFALNSGLGSLTPYEKMVVGRLLLSTLLTNNSGLLRTIVDSVLVDDQAAPYKASETYAGGIEVSGVAKANATLGFRFTKDVAGQPGEIPYGVEAAGGIGAKVGGTLSLTLAPQVKEATPQFDVKGGVELSGAFGIGSGQVTSKEGKLKAGLLEKLRVSLKGTIAGTVKTGLTVDKDTFEPKKLAISFATSKGYGWQVGVQSGGSANQWESVGGAGGQGAKSTLAFTFTERKSMFDLFGSLRTAFGAASAFVKVPLPPYVGGELDLVLGPSGVQREAQRLRDHLISSDTDYAVTEELGDALSLPTGLAVAWAGIDLEIGKTLAIDRAISFTGEKGVVRQGRVYPLARYRKDSLIPDLPSDSDDFKQFAKLAIEALAASPGTGIDRVEGPPSAPGENRVKSNMTAQMEWQGDGEPAFTPRILSWQYRAADLPSRFQRPWQRSGPIDAPRYGIGGFHQFAPVNHVFVRPATLTFFYRDDEVQWVDERSLAVYRWNDGREDWDYIGGAVDPVANTVTASVDRMALYTLGPPIPAGNIGLDVVSSQAGGTPQAPQTTVTYRSSTPLVTNTGVPVANGTFYTVLATDVGTQALAFGTVNTPDADPSTPGVQVAAAGGAIEFTITYAAANTSARVFAYSREGTALGFPVLPLRP